MRIPILLTSETKYDFTFFVDKPISRPSYKRPPFGIILIENDTLPEGTIELQGPHNAVRMEGFKPNTNGG